MLYVGIVTILASIGLVVAARPVNGVERHFMQWPGVGTLVALLVTGLFAGGVTMLVLGAPG